jgi:hypothetical protein
MLDVSPPAIPPLEVAVVEVAEAGRRNLNANQISPRLRLILLK